MATQELKSVTIRVPLNLLELIEAKVSDRDTRTDVIIKLLNQSLTLQTPKSEVNISDVEQKVSEINHRVDDLSKSLDSVRQQITLLDIKPIDDRNEWIAKQLESFESRLSIVEKTKLATESHTKKQLDLLETEPIDAEPVNEATTNPIEEVIQTSDTVSLEPLTQAELADRFGAKNYRSQISERKFNLAEWSKSKDPEGIAWEYRAETKKYYPLSQ